MGCSSSSSIKSEITNNPDKVIEWFYYPNNNLDKIGYNSGMWILIYPISEMKEVLIHIKHLFNTQPLDFDLIGIKCLNFEYHTDLQEGAIMFYFCNSEEEYTITKKGKELLKLLNYTHTSHIVYQTTKNSKYQYILQNIRYIPKCELCKKTLTCIDSKLRNVCTDCKTIRTKTLDRLIDESVMVPNK